MRNSDNGSYTEPLNGKEKWSDRSAGSAKFSPSAQGEALFVASDDKKLAAYRLADGELIGTFPSDRMKTPAISSGRNIYFVAYDNTLGRDELCSVEVEPDSSGWLTRLGRPQWRIPLTPERNE